MLIFYKEESLTLVYVYINFLLLFSLPEGSNSGFYVEIERDFCRFFVSKEKFGILDWFKFLRIILPKEFYWVFLKFLCCMFYKFFLINLL